MSIREERRGEILQLFQKKPQLTIKELKTQLYYSESTIRRELEAMEKLRLLRRIHGGAMLLDMPSQESPLSIRQNSNQVLKQAIGRYASSLVENGDTIVLDASSTAMEMIPFLGDFHDLTIITNGLLTAINIKDNLSCTLYCIGGRLRQSSASSLTGLLAKNGLKQLHCNKMFFSSKCVDTSWGISDLVEDEAEIKQAMMEQAEHIYFLADRTKFNQNALCPVCDLSMPHKLITNAGCDLSSSLWNPYREKIVLVDG